MISHSELKGGVQIIIDGKPYEVLSSNLMKKAQRRVVIQTKIKNLLTGSVLERNFHQGDVFEEADISRIEVKFLYNHHDRYFFSEKDNPSKRLDLGQESIGKAAVFLKPNMIVEGIVFNEKIININLPIKVQLKVADSPPGTRGDRAQGGTKVVTLETGAKVNVPLFVEIDDVVEVNTESGDYVKRVE